MIDISVHSRFKTLEMTRMLWASSRPSRSLLRILNGEVTYFYVRQLRFGVWANWPKHAIAFLKQ